MPHQQSASSQPYRRDQPTQSQISCLFTVFGSKLEENNPGPMAITDISGVQDPLFSHPRQWCMRITCTKSHPKAQQMDLAIANLLAKRAVREVQSRDNQFTSTLLLVEKENGKFRPVINLWGLNLFLGKESFKMEGLQVVRSLLQNGDFMMKVDLKDAYYAIPIHRKFCGLCTRTESISFSAFHLASHLLPHPSQKLWNQC